MSGLSIMVISKAFQRIGGSPPIVTHADDNFACYFVWSVKMAAKKVSKAAKRVADAKSKQASARVKRSNAKKPINLPDGYKVIERAPNWDVDTNPIIKGKRGPITELTFGRGTNNEYDAECFVVDDAEVGEVAVWRSGGLAQLFDETEEGDEVYIEFLGYGEPKDDDQNPPKLFHCAVKADIKRSTRNPF